MIWVFWALMALLGAAAVSLVWDDQPDWMAELDEEDVDDPN